MRDLSDDEVAQIRASSDAWVIALHKGLLGLEAAVLIVLAIFYYTRPM